MSFINCFGLALRMLKVGRCEIIRSFSLKKKCFLKKEKSASECLVVLSFSNLLSYLKNMKIRIRFIKLISCLQRDKRKKISRSKEKLY